MKKIFLLLVTSMVLALPLSAQWVFNSFESSTKDSMMTITKNSSAKKWYLLQYDTAYAVHGAKAYKTSWKLHASESYGGNDGFEFKRPRAKDSSYFAKKYRAVYRDSTYMNVGTAKYISIWFNNLKKSTSGAGTVQMRLKLHDAGPGSLYWSGGSEQVEDWYFQTDKVFDQDPGWKQLLIPIKDMGAGAPQNDLGFYLPGWSGTQNDGKLNMEKIIGYTIEWTSGALPAGMDSVSSGEIVWDKMQLLDYAYSPIYMFNDYVKDTTIFNKGIGFWGANGGITLGKETVDTLVSPSALSVAYKVNISEGWGGYANMVYNLPAGSIVQDLSGNTHINMWLKVVDPLVSSSGKVENVMSLRFVLREGVQADATAGGDEWFTRADVRLDSIGKTLGWQMISMPLVGLSGSWGEFAAKPYDGFYAVNGSDGTMNFDKIKQIKLEFSASKDAGQPNAADLVHSGKVLLSTIIPSGFRSTDKTPPAAVTGILGTPGAFANLITWTDVPNEPSSKYNVYMSEKTFTDGEADATVENLPPFGLPLGTQFATHVLIAPGTDQNVSYYYGVAATDAAGNTNKTTNVVGPITNKAKGVPTIATAPPATFKADGALGEWTTIAPIVLNSFRTTPTAHIAPNGKLKDSLDLSVKAYLAIDSKNLYVAFDVVDDTVSIDTAGTSYMQDSPDLFIGLYDWRGKKHSGYANGKTPDYHLRFNSNRIFLDNGAKVVMYTGANYSWKKKTLSSGYIVEAMIPFALFKEIVPGDSVFVPKEGMRIPIDFSINDRDGLAADRDCILCYSTMNDDNSWEHMYRWTHTWIGNKWVTGVKQDAGVPNTYALLQNYPNPFNPTTTINYRLAQSGHVTLTVFDVLGREVMKLVNGVEDVGNHTVQLNGTRLASGMYIYKIEAGSFTSVKKMMFLK
jgi:hypothetical protein